MLTPAYGAHFGIMINIWVDLSLEMPHRGISFERSTHIFDEWSAHKSGIYNQGSNQKRASPDEGTAHKCGISNEGPAHAFCGRRK